jgi:bacterial/archaeal transporter family-2 protein
MNTPASQRTSAHPVFFLAAFGTGCLLTLMVHLNGQLAHYGNALFSSWVAHGTGTVAAALYIAALYRGSRKAPAPEAPKAPFWAYLGGISGAATVMLTSTTVNSELGLSGTLALGLVGQVIFSLLADGLGLFGMPRRRPGVRDIASLGLVLAGSALIILFGHSAP